MLERTFTRRALAPLLAAIALACAPSAKPPVLSVHLAATPGDYAEVNVHVDAVLVEGPSGWTNLSLPDVTVNLARLTGGVAAELVERTRVPAGAYRTLRLVLGERASVRLRDGSVHPLELPAALRGGLEIPLDLEARPGTEHDVVVGLDAAGSVRRAGAGAAERFVLEPQVLNVERLARRDRGRARAGGGAG